MKGYGGQKICGGRKMEDGEIGYLFLLSLPHPQEPFVTGNQELCDAGLGLVASSQRELSEFSCLGTTV